MWSVWLVFCDWTVLLSFWTVVLEKTLESPLACKEIEPVHPKGSHSWMFIGKTDAEAETPMATWCKELTHWKRLWCWERLKAGGEGDNQGWDGWMASLTQCTWVWANSRRWFKQGNLACCHPWAHKESDTTVQLNKMCFFKWRKRLIIQVKRWRIFPRNLNS